MQCVMLMEVELFPQYLLVIDVSSMSVRFIEPTISYTKELKSLVYVFSSISIVFFFSQGAVQKSSAGVRAVSHP
jgi:hypothetical protein